MQIGGYRILQVVGALLTFVLFFKAVDQHESSWALAYLAVYYVTGLAICALMIWWRRQWNSNQKNVTLWLECALCIVGALFWPAFFLGTIDAWLQLDQPTPTT